MNFDSKTNFRHLLAFSLLSAKDIIVETEDAFEDYELNFLNLICLISKGSKVILQKRNHNLSFWPGTIEMDQFESNSFDCGNSWSISYYIEPLLILGLFSKNDLTL